MINFDKNLKRISGQINLPKYRAKIINKFVNVLNLSGIMDIKSSPWKQNMYKYIFY